MRKLKSFISIAAIFTLIITIFVLASCVDIIRGNKNLTVIQKTFDSQIEMYSDTEATVQADKDYTDSGKIDLPIK